MLIRRKRPAAGILPNITATATPPNIPVRVFRSIAARWTVRITKTASAAPTAWISAAMTPAIAARPNALPLTRKSEDKVFHKIGNRRNSVKKKRTRRTVKVCLVLFVCKNAWERAGQKCYFPCTIFKNFLSLNCSFVKNSPL